MKRKTLYIALAISFIGLMAALVRGQPTVEMAAQKVIPAATIPQISEGELYKIVSVIDGDTVKVNLGSTTETVRLIGMDTPETVDPRKVVQCFAREASDKAKEILSGKNVRIEVDKLKGRDKYDRLLAYIFLEDGTFYNEFMIKEGYAHEYTYQSEPYKYQDDLKKSEDGARTEKKGLWADSTCAGNTTQAAKGGVYEQFKASQTDTPSLYDTFKKTQPQVKKSSTGICHEKGISSYYERTKNYTPYDSVDACLESGGRLPK